MSIYLSGVNFTQQVITPTSDAVLYARALTDGILEGCAMTYAGTSLTLAAGYILAAGREVVVPSSQAVSMNGAVSGYARLVLTVDLTQTATETTFRQARLDVDYANSIGGFSSLQRQAINNGGSVYQVELCVCALGSSGITSIARRIGKACAGSITAGTTDLTDGVSQLDAGTLYVYYETGA